MAGFSDFLFGTPAGLQQVERFNPQQMGAQNQAIQQALSLLQGQGSNLSNQFNFQPIAQQEINRFQTQTIPSIAERFTSLGSGAQRSSAFAGQLGQAGTGLGQGLAALQSQYGLQQQGLQQNLLSQLLGFGGQQQHETFQTPGTQGAFATLLPLLLQGGIGAATGGLGFLPGVAGGGMGALQGLLGSFGQQQMIGK